MYCLHREEAPDHWVQEMCFQTELRAYVRARVMSRVKPCTYRVVDQTTNGVLAIVRNGKGIEIQ